MNILAETRRQTRIGLSIHVPFAISVYKSSLARDANRINLSRSRLTVYTVRRGYVIKVTFYLVE